MVHDFALARFSRRKKLRYSYFLSTNFSIVGSSSTMLIHNSGPEIIFRIITFFIGRYKVYSNPNTMYLPSYNKMIKNGFMWFDIWAIIIFQCHDRSSNDPLFVISLFQVPVFLTTETRPTARPTWVPTRNTSSALSLFSTMWVYHIIS